jgi:hypothetical protein
MKLRDSGGIWKGDAIGAFKTPNSDGLRSLPIVFLCDFELFGDFVIKMRKTAVSKEAKVHPVTCHEGTKGEWSHTASLTSAVDGVDA